jgi:hypothetical protein
MAGDKCRSGCKARDHASYAECLLDAAPSARNSTQSVSVMYGREAERDAISREYRAARAQGIQPATTQLHDIRSAVAASRQADTALTVRS